MDAGILEYRAALVKAVQAIDVAAVTRAADVLFDAWTARRAVYVFGNGGSWSTAEHFACDLRKWSRVPSSGGVRATALTLTPLATAYANDFSYAEVFSRQLNDLMAEGDVAVGISCSGRSENVLAALHLASKWGQRIALTGRMPGLTPIKKHADVVISVDAADIRVQEDAHLAICHILAGEVRERIAREA